MKISYTKKDHNHEIDKFKNTETEAGDWRNSLNQIQLELQKRSL